MHRRDLAARGTRLVASSASTRAAAASSSTCWAPRYQPIADGPSMLAPDPVRSVNDNSLVVAIHYRRPRRSCSPATSRPKARTRVVAAGLGGVDVVKVAHHGSPTSSSPAFVAATPPELAVISCGVANAFGFPAAEVVERWRAAGARVARTDLDGAITVIVAADGELSPLAP